MAVHSIKSVQTIPATLDQAWGFFSSFANLAAITPAHMGFKVRSQHHGTVMYPGQIIEYTVRPVLGIPLYWMTEITHMVDKTFFIDEQRYGPFSMWHHQHHFKTINGGVEMTDIVHYKLPLWVIGDIAHLLFVKQQLQELFSYRFKKVEAVFGEWKGQTTGPAFY